MKYLLDTNICIYLIKSKPKSLLNKLMQKNVGDIGISAITLSELEYGVEKSLNRERNKLALTEFIAPLTILSYDDSAASTYGEVRAFLEKEGIPIGPLDMLIGAHALSIQSTLVTNNDREFRRIPGLKVENWA